MSNSYPALAFVDTLLADPNRSFRNAPDAPRLEQFARALLKEVWGDQPWGESQATDSSLRYIVSALERFRWATSQARDPEHPLRLHPPGAGA